MDLLEAIKKRRSVRSYLDKEVSQELILKILDAGRKAPSGCNTQPWKFKIIMSEEDKEKLRKSDVIKQPFVYQAPVLIFCCSDPDAYSEEKYDPIYDDPNDVCAVRDLSYPVQNMTLAATALGLGTCLVGWVHKEKVKEVLGIPKGFIVSYVMTLGYPADEGKAAPKKEIDEILI